MILSGQYKENNFIYGIEGNDGQNLPGARALHREMLIQKLKQEGLRITKQRLAILDVILEGECTCCKEIYHEASKRDDKIGMATVYRMINTLKDIGEIDSNSAYKIKTCEECEQQKICQIELDDHTVIELSENSWNQIVQVGLSMCGYIRDKKVRSIKVG